MRFCEYCAEPIRDNFRDPSGEGRCLGCYRAALRQVEQELEAYWQSKEYKEEQRRQGYGHAGTVLAILQEHERKEEARR